VRLWIDTDVGTNPDDAVALLLAVAHPGVDLAGVSTVGPDAPWRAEVAACLLAAVGMGGVPVVAGLPAAVMVDAGAEELLAIGPLTNLAAALPVLDPRPRLTVMGGALRPVHHRGQRRIVESNFAADPAAAAAVLTVPGATLVPLDVTAATRLDSAGVESLVAAAPVLSSVIEDWQARHHADVVLHDPAALLVAAGDPVARLEPRSLAVDGEGRVMETAGGVEHRVVVELDARAVIAAVLERLTFLRRPADPPG
jgi:inosine-uridine nucleoside N-ribohydrolase